MFSWQFSPLKPASRSNTSYLYTPVVYHHHTGIVLRTPVVSLTGSSHDNNRWEFHNPIIASDSWSKGRWFDSRPGRYQVKLVLFQRSMAYSEIFYGKPSYNNNNNNNNRTTFTVLTSWLKEWLREFARFLRWMQNSARRLQTFGPCLWPWAIAPPPRLRAAVHCYQLRTFPIPLSHSAPPLPMFPLVEFRDEVNPEETRVMGLLCGESCMILYFNRFWLIHPCDRRTDGQTDGRQHIARCNLHICCISRTKK